MGTPRPFGKRWGCGYGPGETNAVCGYFTNPDAAAIHLVRWCNEPAIYGFRFHCAPNDILVVLGCWYGACEAHATTVRQQGEASEIWSLPRKAES